MKRPIELDLPPSRHVGGTELSPRLAGMKRRLRAGEHHCWRDTETIDVRTECEKERLSWPQRAARLIRRMCEAQTVVLEPDERIVFTRTVRKVPLVYSEAELRVITAGRTLHELGPISNICADWGMVLSQGLLARKQAALATRERLAQASRTLHQSGMADQPMTAPGQAGSAEFHSVVPQSFTLQAGDHSPTSGRPEACSEKGPHETLTPGLYRENGERQPSPQPSPVGRERESGTPRRSFSWMVENEVHADSHPMGEGGPSAEFLDCAIETIDAVLALARRYAEAARAKGRHDLADILDRVPAQPATTFHEALQALRLCHAVLWLGGHYHCGLGRFDQYMWPYLQGDLEAGRLDQAAAEELLAEFFISLNKDSDLYPGIQQGDNGQSLMLGGVRRDGHSGVNPLTSMVLRVARAVAMIDPKINLRVDRHTDLELLALAAELTRLGLGFPQYANDEVVIPGLVAAGYEWEDARDYTVAACWEFSIPGQGMEVVNIGAASMPSAVDQAIRKGLAAGDSFQRILERTGEDLRAQVAALAEASRKLLLPPAPYYSVLMNGCLERGRDLSQGLKYNNFGIHGAASANAADALAAVKTLVVDEQKISPGRLLRALETDFAADEPLLEQLRAQAPKVGNHDDRADALLVKLFDLFAEACAAAGDNGRGGRYRAGSGSAMYYVWLARGHPDMREPAVGATADGRRAGEFFSSSLAPSPGATVRGPLSVLQSFSKLDYRRICNGGPLTMELAESLFRGRDTVQKVALFIRAFVQSGCQQLQLNTLNVDTLRDAQRHPELHQNLVVRVWGWSGYFCELDRAYQDQIIGRHVYGT
jgi:pyruvate-formate lyase